MVVTCITSKNEEISLVRDKDGCFVEDVEVGFFVLNDVFYVFKLPARLHLNVWFLC